MILSGARCRGLPLLLATAFLCISGCESRKVGASSGGFLELRVFASETGSPCAGLACEVFSGADLLWRGTTDEGGAAAFRRVSGWPVTVKIHDPGGSRVPAQREFDAPGSYSVEVPRGSSLAIRVLDHSGAPPAMARAVVWSVAGPPREQRLPGGSGVLGPVPSGPAKLVLSAPGHVTTVLDLEVESPAREEPIDLGVVRLAVGGVTLRGRVSAAGDRMPGQALLRRAGAGHLTEVTRDGSFVFTGLPVPTEESGTHEAMLVLLRGSTEVYARDLELEARDIALGTIELD